MGTQTKVGFHMPGTEIEIQKARLRHRLSAMNASFFVLVTAFLLSDASSASAQWTRVTEVPITIVYSVWVQDDTILATADSVVYISTDGGANWKESAVVVSAAPVQAARARNGRIYAGTFGQGVFTSDDLGDSWQAFNQGLTGGAFDTQRFIVDLVARGDSLYAATAGDGPWVRNLTSGSWTHFSNLFEADQASDMSSIATGGTRLLACAGANGTVFFREPGDGDWTESLLKNIALSPGTSPFSAIWTGSRWVVGTNTAVYHSAQGQSPWTFVDVGLGSLVNVVFALRPPDVLASFGTATFAEIEYSHDNGATWQALDTLPSTFIFGLATHGNTLYAARLDGLWTRSISTVAVQAKSWGSVKALYRTPGK
jgi:BNR/Asp-box repeat